MCLIEHILLTFFTNQKHFNRSTKISKILEIKTLIEDAIYGPVDRMIFISMLLFANISADRLLFGPSIV